MPDYPVFAILAAAAEKWPDHVAVYDDWGQQTFNELFTEADHLRQQLIDSGIKEGMAVGIMAKNGRNFIAGIFAVIGTGAVAMPMSHQLKEQELNEVAKDARLSAIIDDGSSKIFQPSHFQTIPLINGFFRLTTLVNLQEVEPFAPHVESPAFMRFTSGTTGKSKGVIISHTAALERTEAANKILALGPGDTVLWVLPMAYHFVVSVLLYVRYGAAIAIARDFLPLNVIAMANACKATLLYASPMQIRLLANTEDGADMPTLKRAISTSAGITADVCKLFENRFNLPVSQAYGIIEIGLPMINTFNNSDHPEAVGHVLPDFHVRIFDEDHHALPVGKVGKLGIKGPGMFDAYLDPPLKRHQVTVDGYFLTADFASQTADGLVTIEGREKSVMNIAGNKVFPEEVEGVLEDYEGVKMARIQAVPHPLMGQILQAEIISECPEKIDVEDLISFCRKRLSTYKVPQRIHFVDQLPVTPTGKLIRF
jgi:acyl-CoA synthetase (AMP-forming)/AMP-acid ligase II